MLAIHPNARTTPAVRAEIARSSERSGLLAERYGVSAETVRKWRQRGPAECRDRVPGPAVTPGETSTTVLGAWYGHRAPVTPPRGAVRQRADAAAACPATGSCQDAADPMF